MSLGEASFFRSYTKSVKKHTRSEVHPQSRRLKTDHHEQMSGALVSLINLLKLFTEMLVIEHKQHSVSCFLFFFFIGFYSFYVNFESNFLFFHINILKGTVSKKFRKL